jgi:hypothetical protein
MRVLLLLAVGAAVLARAPAVLAAPRLTLDPTSSPPGRLVTVSGSGFCSAAGCSGVTIQIYGAPLATGVRVSRTGRFVRRVRVPGGPEAGETGVVAIQHLPNGRDATAIAFLTVILRTQPPTPTPTTTVTLPTSTASPPPTRPPATTASQSAPGTTSPPPRTTRAGTETEPSPEPSTVPVTTAHATATAAEAAGATTAAGGDGGAPWAWLAVLAAVGLLAAAGGWAVTRARRAR